MHEDEIDLDEQLVERLLATLPPSALPSGYAGLPLRRLASSGSSNALFRLGRELLVRVPRQPGGSRSILKEQRWLPYVAPHLPVSVPEVVAVGGPTEEYPESWSVVRFLDGEPPALPEPGLPPRHALAHDLAAAVTALRELGVPADAAVDPDLRWYRGEPLAAYDEDLGAYLDGTREIPGLDLDVGAVERVWHDALSVPGAHGTGPAHWFHGDLLAENLLARADRLAAVLDFGGLAVGNPAVDLAVAWELLDPEARTTFRSAVAVTDDEWLLGRGWALALGVMALPYYWETMPGRCASRLAQVRAVLADAARE